MNRTGSKVMIVLVFTENNKNKGPFSSKKVIFSTKIVLALGIRSNKEVPRQPSKIWTLSTRKNRFALWATSAATGRFHQSYPLPLTNPPCMSKQAGPSQVEAFENEKGKCTLFASSVLSRYFE